MIRNYLKTAFRSLLKYKFHSAVNLVGLCAGLVVSIIAIMFVVDETSFDGFHSKKERIYRLNKRNMKDGAVESLTAETSGMMGPTIAIDYPEVESAVRYEPLHMVFAVTNKEKSVIVKEAEWVYTDSTFFDVFDFELLQGDAHMLGRDHQQICPAVTRALQRQ